MTGTLVAPRSMAARADSPRVVRHGAITLHSARDIEGIAAAGRVVAAALHAATAAARAGGTTGELDATVREVIAAAGGEPAFLGYPNPTGGDPFPGACCTSINDEVVHGIPGQRRLAAHDILSIDIGVRLDGWYADAARSIVVGHAQGERHTARESFVACAQSALHAAIAMMEPGRRWSDIAARIQQVALAGGHGLVDGWMGHGIGRAMHMPPQVPCMVTAGLVEQRDFTLLPGMVLAVEPLLVLGAASTPDAEGCLHGVPTDMAYDGWAVLVRDGRPAAHVEHTVAVTRHGPRVLTAAAEYSELAPLRCCDAHRGGATPHDCSRGGGRR